MACLHRLDGSRRHGWRFDSRNLSRLCNLLGRLRGFLAGGRGLPRQGGNLHLGSAVVVVFGIFGHGNS